MEEISLAALPSGYDSDNDLEESDDEDKNEDEDDEKDGDINGEIVQGGVFEGSQVLDSLLADASSPRNLTDEQSVEYWLPADPADRIAKGYDMYTLAVPHEDGLYHCPWEGQPSCNHQPEKSKAAYE
ncbi:hypothetical protein NW757_012730 [Fusarium falciforme]|nr:hypothetical protein NW757_012730 [Fusarium falciforme]